MGVFSIHSVGSVTFTELGKDDVGMNVSHCWNYTFFSWRNSPHWARASSFTRFLIHNDEPPSVGFLWTSDKLVAETST